ncbi:MAG: hypothetical protein R3266_13965, partial [Gemmatimonadota bacterium]|nr:hypothetical protein [Gemmatimonadota bacterium]
GLHETVVEVAERYGLRVDAVDSGYGADDGPSLGSASVISVEKPAIAILAEGPVRGYSFGWAWHALDRQYEIPVTPIRTGSVAGRPLDRFDVLVIPSASSGALSRELGEGGVDRIRRWVREGGTLVTIGSATDFAADSARLDLIDLRSWYDTEDGEDAQRFSVPGAIVRGLSDEAYWITAGVNGSELPVLVNGSRIYLDAEPPPSGSRRPAVRLAPSEDLRLSGHLWTESEERLGDAVFLYEQRVGAGRVIAFAEDPNFRGFWRGVDRLFLNAVLVGPSAP